MKTIVITGGTSGIGYQACLQLAKLGHKIIMICRNENAAKQKCEEIKNQTNNDDVFYQIADLSDKDSVKNAAAQFIAKYETIDVLINNAADFDLSNKCRQLNAEGIEKQFATNVIAPFILCERFMPLLQKSKGKIINISTKGLVVYPKIRLDFENLNAEKSYRPDKTYYQNKLALLMFSIFMKEKYKGVSVHAVRVTNVKIDINRYPNINGALKRMYQLKSRFSISPEDMAKTYVALSVNEYDGFLYDEKLQEVKANQFVYHKEAQQKLYALLLPHVA